MSVEITTVADDLIVAHDGTDVERLMGLVPDTDYDVWGHAVRTLARPEGDLLCRIGTVNDVHFGEVEAGRVDEHLDGPILHVHPGAEPYPETMNRAAVEEMLAAELDAVIVKGDLSTDGTDEEFADFEEVYGSVFGDRLHTVRGNHDAYRGQDRYAGDQWIELPGVAVALVDTAIPFRPNGALSADQLAWLDEHAASANVPVLVMGHHHQWLPPTEGQPTVEASSQRGDSYFGLEPSSSLALDEVCARQRAIIAYTSGHSHRHRRREMPSGVPSIEVGCVKDFPGTWAEYRVFEGGVVQVVHRISSPEALEWSERCRVLYSDFGLDYTEYALATLADRCFPIALR